VFDPAAYDQALVWDSSLGTGAGATIEPGFLEDYIALSPNTGSLGTNWTQTTASAQPMRDRVTGAGFFRGTRRLALSSLGLSSLRFLHDGTATYRLVLRFRTSSLAANNDIFSTFDGNPNTVGMQVRAASGTGNLVVRWGNGSGTHALTLAAAAAISINTDYTVTVDVAGTTATVYLGGTQVATGTIASPSASNPSHTAVVGNANSGSAPVVGWVPELRVFGGPAGSNLPDREDAETYLTGRWDLSALTAPLAVDWIANFDRSDHTLESGTSADVRRLQTVQNPGALGGTLTQATAASRPYLTRFGAGNAGYFAAANLLSSLAASSFTPRHDGTGAVTDFYRVRVYDLSNGFVLTRTYNSAASNVGTYWWINPSGQVSCFFGNGSANSTISTPAGTIVTNATYTIAVRKSAGSVEIFVNDMVTPAASGSITSPSASAPQTTLQLAQNSSTMLGFISEAVGFGAALSQSEREAVAERMGRHSLEATPQELFGSDLWTLHEPGQFQTSGFGPTNVLRWFDTSGNGRDLILNSGTGTLDAIGTQDAVLVDGDVYRGDSGYAAFMSGTDKGFTVLQWLELVSRNSGEAVWPFRSENSGNPNPKHWLFISTAGNWGVWRYNDAGSLGASSGFITASTAHRFAATCFRAAASAFNFTQIDGTVNVQSDSVGNPCTLDTFQIGGTAAGNAMKHAWLVTVNRAINRGEAAAMRDFFLRQAA
jgi:hypothetical protein